MRANNSIQQPFSSLIRPYYCVYVTTECQGNRITGQTLAQWAWAIYFLFEVSLRHLLFWLNSYQRRGNPET